MPTTGGDLATQMIVLAQHLAEATTRLGLVDARTTTTETRIDSIDTRLGQQQKQLVEQMTELREAIAELMAAEKEPTVWDWSILSQDAAAGAWATLADWAESILDLQLGLVGWAGGKQSSALVRLPPCWSQHRDVIWIVSWLGQEWLRVWQTSAGNPSKQGDWYTRLWPGALARVKTSSARECLSDCVAMPDGVGWGRGDVLELVTADDREKQQEQLRQAFTQSLQRRRQPSQPAQPATPQSQQQAPGPAAGSAPWPRRTGQ